MLNIIKKNENNMLSVLSKHNSFNREAQYAQQDKERGRQRKGEGERDKQWFNI